MKKILIITSRYLPNPSANGINTKYIVDELKKRNYDVTCISAKGDNESTHETIENTDIYRIKPTFYTKLLRKEKENLNSFMRVYYKIFHLIRKVKLAILLPAFPNFDIMHSNKIFKQIETLQNVEKFDCVIGVFKPYSNIAALKKFKSKHKEVVCGSYYLDLLNSMKKPSIMPEGVYESLLRKEMHASAQIFDFSLVAVGGKKLFEEFEFGSLMKKVHFVDFPTFLTNSNKTVNSKQEVDRKETVFTYAGTLSTKYRNPKLLLEALNKAADEVGKIVLNIYGTNDCRELFKNYRNNKYFEINDLGLAPHDTVLDAMIKSDFLINVSNKIQDAVPSKIFEMFSVGKPIVNLVFDPNDITTPYFSKYPYVMNINEWESLDMQVNTLCDFIKNSKGRTCDISKIRESYIENTPEYTVGIIESYIK